MPTFEEKLRLKQEAYAKAFRIEDLNDANDKSTLDILLKTEVMIDDLQQQIQDLMADNPIEQAGNIKKMHDLLRDAGAMIVTYQRTLAIDRKTRKTEETASVADYIRALKRDASEFMEQRIIRVYCPTCKVMAGRIFPVHDHTAFSASFECSQCGKLARARRETRDIMFDVRDKRWRAKYPVEIIQPKQFARGVDDIEADDELVLTGEPELSTTPAQALEEHPIQEDLELGE